MYNLEFIYLKTLISDTSEETDTSAESNTSCEDSKPVAEIDRLSLPILKSKFEEQYSSQKRSNNSQEGANTEEHNANLENSEKDTVVFSTMNISTQNAPLDFERVPVTCTTNSLGLDYDSSDSEST